MRRSSRRWRPAARCGRRRSACWPAAPAGRWCRASTRPRWWRRSLARARLEGLVPTGPIELAFEQDFALLEAAGTTLPWLCVCVPSHWAPEEKVGLPFTSVHAPVADNQLLLAAARQLTQLVTGGGCWERWVWTVTPGASHDQHPVRQPRTPRPGTQDPEDFARHCFLRAERQTFFRWRRGRRCSPSACCCSPCRKRWPTVKTHCSCTAPSRP
ncbi:DUF3445 domain-containing protein [Ramlibacter terrae]|uniref:DUF3445 domain-containing protein n=1 Tax=Ramlibacter terrae TaxID=2732511 RepID=A0ABX6P3Z7_9BURK|nr:DUF3445 domain-containing protein [Ramlibacter terrae]